MAIAAEIHAELTPGRQEHLARQRLVTRLEHRAELLDMRR
jgi:hypothetical protein